jgi:phosphohistidine swiveling domain-containing protein
LCLKDLLGGTCASNDSSEESAARELAEFGAVVLTLLSRCSLSTKDGSITSENAVFGTALYLRGVMVETKAAAVVIVGKLVIVDKPETRNGLILLFK